jgi:hypothetical protein
VIVIEVAMNPIQNPLLLVTERWTLDNIKMNLREIGSGGMD